jgi:DNA-binding transcriptional LysR family regulator
MGDSRKNSSSRTPFQGKLRIRHLETVIAIAYFGSLAKAAGQLHLTQSGLSRAIAEVEEIVQGRLFERTGKGMVCTPLGEAFCRHARLLLGDFDKAEADLSAISKGNLGSLVVGCFSPFVGWPLVDAVRVFKAAHPRVALTVHAGLNERLIDDLDSGRVDVIFGRRLPTLNPEVYRYTDLLEDSVVLACSPAHPLVKKKELALADCVAFPWIVAPEKNRVRVQLEDKLRALGLPLPDFVGALSLEFSSAMIKGTHYICMLPGSVATHLVKQQGIHVLPVTLAFSMPPLAAVWRRERSNTRQIRDFIEALASIVSTTN